MGLSTGAESRRTSIRWKRHQACSDKQCRACTHALVLRALRHAAPPLQKVTRVVGFEAFLLEAETLAGDLQRHFAASATVAPLPGAQAKGHEIALQVPPTPPDTLPPPAPWGHAWLR